MLAQERKESNKFAIRYSLIQEACRLHIYRDMYMRVEVDSHTINTIYINIEYKITII